MNGHFLDSFFLKEGFWTREFGIRLVRSIADSSSLGKKKPIPKFQEKPKHPEIGGKKISLFILQISRLRQL